MRLDDAFHHAVDALTASQTPFVFVGAMGVFACGRPRSTRDLDVVVSPREFRRLEGELTSRGFVIGERIGDTGTPDLVRFWIGSDLVAQVSLFVFVARVAFEQEVIATCRPARLFERVVPVARTEAMLVYKLLAERRKDLIDVDSIMETRLTTAQPIDWPLVIRWATDWGIEDRVEALRARFPSA